MELLVCAWDWLKANLSTEFFAALAAIMSFVVAWRQHVWNKRNHLVSVRPFLSDFVSTSTRPAAFQYEITNKGLGPALIDEFKVLWQDNQITMTDLKGRIEHELNGYFEVLTGEINGHFAMATGEAFSVISINEIPGRRTTASDIPAEIDRVVTMIQLNCNFQIKYRSFLSNEQQTFSAVVLEREAREKGILVE